MFASLRRSLRSGGLLARAAALACAGLLAAPLQAQGEEPPAHICNVFAGETSAEGLQTIYASCWGNGIVLGEAERFEASMNMALGATAVELERNGQTRLLLIRALPGGQPIIEDMGSVLAEAMGRTSLGNTDGIGVDLNAFAQSGMIGVMEAGAASEEQLAARGAVQSSVAAAASAQLDVGAFIQNDPVSANALSDQ